MSGKTCGTCAHAKTQLVCPTPKAYVQPDDCACGDWAERADSVEQVALDMLRELMAISVYAPCSSKESIAARQAKAFNGRLHALGVVSDG